MARYQSAGKPTVRVAVPMDWAADAKGSNYHLNRIRRLAKAHAKDFAFAAISPSAHELSEFGVGGNDFSVTISDAAGRKFAFEGTWNPGKDDPKEVSAFLAAFLKGEVEPYVKSEPVPEGKANGVTVAVGKTFESVVLDDSKDVFIEFYAPWCAAASAPAPLRRRPPACVRAQSEREAVFLARAHDLLWSGCPRQVRPLQDPGAEVRGARSEARGRRDPGAAPPSSRRPAAGLPPATCSRH